MKREIRARSDFALRRLGWLLTVVGIGLAGCSSDKLYPVKGKILLPDGKPLTAGKVLFVGIKSRTRSEWPLWKAPANDFTFKGPSGDSALPVGEYRVVIEPAVNAPAKKSAGKLTLFPFAAKYSDEDGSDLKAVVTTDESQNNFEFKLEPRRQIEFSSKPTSKRARHAERD